MYDTGNEWLEGTINNLDIYGTIINEEKRPALIYAASGYIYATSGDGWVLQADAEDDVNDVTLVEGDRVLVNQAVSKNYNGIFRVINVEEGTAELQRDDDANDVSYFAQQFYITISSGHTDYRGKTYKLKNTITTLDTDDIEFELYSNENYLTIDNSDLDKIGQFMYIKGNNTYYSELTGIPQQYIQGDTLYSTPYQIFRNTGTGFNGPRYMCEKTDGNVIMVDTLNDRIVELDSNNQLVKAIQGNTRLTKIDRDFVALSATYNPNLGKMWIAFSQYVSTSLDKSKISLTNRRDTIVLSAEDPNVSGASINVTTMSSVSNKSSTLIITFTSTYIAQIQNWIDNGDTIELVIEPTAVTCEGSDATTATSSNPETTHTLDPYMAGPPAKFIYLGRSAYTGYTFSSLNTIGVVEAVGDEEYTGLPETDTTDVDSGDFDGDGEITNSATDTPIDPIRKVRDSNITLTVTIGNIVFDNIYNPLYLQLSDTDWIITSVEEHTVYCFDDDLVRSWYIPVSSIGLREDVDGNAWQLSNGNIAISVPASATATSETNIGGILVLNRNAGTISNPTIAVVANIAVNRGDVVRVIPTTTETEFWVAISDRVNNGINSRISRINYSGEETWRWDGTTNNIKIYKPNDLKVLTNNTILVSE
jgi:hypothetical protein